MVADLPTQEEYFDIGAAEIIVRNETRDPKNKLSTEIIRTEGSNVNIILSATAAIANELTRHLAIRMAALFLDSAEGEDLDRLIADRFSNSLVRKSANKAIGELTFYRTIPPSSGALGTIPVGTRFSNAQGVQFELLQSVNFGNNATGPITAQAQCVQIGTIGNVSKNEIINFVTPPFDNSISVTNNTVFSGGSSTETDTDFRIRARNFFLTLRRGTLTAIEEGAKTVSGVKNAKATEELSEAGYPTGRIFLCISDENGQSNTVLENQVLSVIDEYRPAGIIVIMKGVERLELNITINVEFTNETDINTASSQLENAILESVNSLQPGETLWLSSLISVARKIPGLVVAKNAITQPTYDYTPELNQVIKTTISKITINGI